MITRAQSRARKATATTMANWYNTVMFFHDIFKNREKDFSNSSLQIVSPVGYVELSQLTNARECSCHKSVLSI